MNNTTDAASTTDERLLLIRQNLAELGLAEASLSEHDSVIRIQLSKTDFERGIEMREAIVSRIKPIGYRFVALDLEGFK